MSLGELYYDHFTHLMGEPLHRGGTYRRKGLPSIQILVYRGPFTGCRSFCSVGLTHYQPELGEVVEVFLPIDDGWDEISDVLGQSLSYMVERRMNENVQSALAAIDGLEHHHPKFVARYGKSALYFSNPFGLPDDFATVTTGTADSQPHTVGRVALAVFLTQPEFDFLANRGPEEFESLLQERQVDPFHLRRPSSL